MNQAQSLEHWAIDEVNAARELPTMRVHADRLGARGERRSTVLSV
jgi:hypothetical protein